MKIHSDAELLLMKLPDKNWNFDELLHTADLSWEFIQTYRNGFFLKNISQDGLYFKNLTIDIIKQNSTINWNYNAFSGNKNVTLQIVKDNKNIPWNDYELSCNENITLQMMKDNQELAEELAEIHGNGFCWDFLYAPSQKNNITIKDIEENDQITWNYSDLSSNPNLTWDFIYDKINIGWNFNTLSKNRVITVDIIKTYPEFKRSWNYKQLSLNPNITPKIVERNPQITWDYSNLAENSNFSFEYIMKNSAFTSKFDLGLHLSKNVGISWKTIVENPQIKWSFENMSSFLKERQKWVEIRDDVYVTLSEYNANLDRIERILKKNSVPWEINKKLEISNLPEDILEEIIKMLKL